MGEESDIALLTGNWMSAWLIEPEHADSGPPADLFSRLNSLLNGIVAAMAVLPVMSWNDLYLPVLMLRSIATVGTLGVLGW